MNLWDFLSEELKILVISSLPIIELRGAIPYAISRGMNPLHAALLCIGGSMVPVPFLLFFLKPFFASLRNVLMIEKFEKWLIRRVEKKAKRIKKYSVFGLVLFVAVPLPSTGVWTGAIAAAFFNLRNKYAFFAILLGNTIAAFIITFLSYFAVSKM
ncbi:COG2426 family protein [Wukongibacter sp. M2B1]|uniref:COG2426 family protein n=1 Tax=Wukongibacter sp. M2B1 TaxID=3088895 RepID=UPI003D793C5B